MCSAIKYWRAGVTVKRVGVNANNWLWRAPLQAIVFIKYVSTFDAPSIATHELSDFCGTIRILNELRINGGNQLLHLAPCYTKRKIYTRIVMNSSGFSLRMTDEVDGFLGTNPSLRKAFWFPVISRLLSIHIET